MGEPLGKDKSKSAARETTTSMNTRLDEMDAKLDKILESNTLMKQLLNYVTRSKLIRQKC